MILVIEVWWLNLGLTGYPYQQGTCMCHMQAKEDSHHIQIIVWIWYDHSEPPCGMELYPFMPTTQEYFGTHAAVKRTHSIWDHVRCTMDSWLCLCHGLPMYQSIGYSEITHVVVETTCNCLMWTGIHYPNNTMAPYHLENHVHASFPWILKLQKIIWMVTHSRPFDSWRRSSVSSMSTGKWGNLGDDEEDTNVVIDWLSRTWNPEAKEFMCDPTVIMTRRKWVANSHELWEQQKPKFSSLPFAWSGI